MKIFVRVFAICGLILGLCAGALALFMPRIVDSDWVRQRIETLALEALGREVRYRDLDFGVFPPSLLLVEPTVAGATADAAPLVKADQIALRVALLPLFARSIVIDSLAIDGATLRLVRTRDGIEFPVLPVPPESPLPDPATTDAAHVEVGVEEGLGLALRGFELSDATLILEDRASSPPVIWELGNIAASARGESLDAPLEFELDSELASGGVLAMRGTASLSGEIEFSLTLDALSLAQIRPYLGDDFELGGTLSGTVELLVNLTDAAVAPTGHFDLDATGAAFQYGDAFVKPVGTAALLSGQIVSEAGNPGVDELGLTLRNLEATGRLRTGERMRASIHAAPFDLTGWEALVPALTGYDVSGRVSAVDLAIATDPLDLRGTLSLDEVTLTLPEQADVVLRGDVVAQGDGAATRNFSLAVAGQVLSVEGSIHELAKTPHYRLRFDTEAADTNRLVSVFAGKRDAVFGPLDAHGDVSGRIDAPLESLEGSVRFDITNGRVVGVSLLQEVFDSFGSLGAAAQVAGAAFGGPNLQRFYGDDFEAIRGTLDLAAGAVRTDDFHMLYRDYRVDLSGAIGLTDLALDMRGKLTIFEPVDAAVAADAGASEARPTRREIPLAAVGGTLDAPRVRVTADVARGFAASYGLRGKPGRKLEDAIDKNLGKGTGGIVVDVLEDILGGKRTPTERRTTPSPGS